MFHKLIWIKFITLLIALKYSRNVTEFNDKFFNQLKINLESMNRFFTFLSFYFNLAVLSSNAIKLFVAS